MTDMQAGLNWTSERRDWRCRHSSAGEIWQKIPRPEPEEEQKPARRQSDTSNNGGAALRALERQSESPRGEIDFAPAARWLKRLRNRRGNTRREQTNFHLQKTSQQKCLPPPEPNNANSR